MGQDGHRNRAFLSWLRQLPLPPYAGGIALARRTQGKPRSRLRGEEMQQCWGNIHYNGGRLHEIAQCKQKICRLICRGNTVGMNEAHSCYCTARRQRIHIQRNLSKNCKKILYCTGKQRKCFNVKSNLTTQHKNIQFLF